MLQKSNIERILSLFFKEPEKEFDLKEISNKINLAHTSVKKNLNILIKEKLIIRKNKIKGKRNFPIYRANINENFVLIKKRFNEGEIIHSGLVNYLVKKTFPNLIMLFGSYSKGEDNEESDIDLFVESSFKEINLKIYETKLKRKINLLFKEDINKLKKEILNNIINGKILYGAIKLK
jgi:predicted nucleotidyltransferase